MNTFFENILIIRDTSSNVDVDVYRYIYSYAGPANLWMRQQLLARMLEYTPHKKNSGIRALYNEVSINIKHLERYVHY